ncbi:nucleotidyltransferase family protein [Burkholderia pyrrocinia]|nr:nucleotidyltransferase family protein [Burkholderia pyrrocinia]QVN23880.1 nucleotidyltransferase family protein [Burkholderia pyrrocinia]
MSAANLEARLTSIARQSAWFWPALVAARSLNLSSWCIGAGVIRNLVWDELHAFRTPSALSDIDVAYFDSTDFSAARDASLKRCLTDMLPGVPWEVTNQATVHLWFERTFGHPVPPLGSLEDAVASWPEFATSVGIVLRDDDSVDVIAPHGLDDLFSMVIRRNPQRVSVDTYRKRVAEKQYRKRWPQVVVVPC